MLFKWIDGLKGISICLIAFVWHYQHFVAPELAPYFNILKVYYLFGDRVVELFFMLSGFGMMLGYGNRIINRNISFSDYIKRRLVRLYPLFVLTTSIVIVLEILIYKNQGMTFVYPNFDMYHLVLNLLLLQNGAVETGWSFNSPSWVISVLVLIYAIFYFVCYKNGDEKKAYYSFGVLTLIGATMTLCDARKPMFNSLLGRGLTCFSIGVILYGIYVRRSSFNAIFLGVIFQFFLLAIYVLMNKQMMEAVGNVPMLVAFGVAPMIIFCSFSVPYIRTVLSLRPFVFLGKISIAIYLFHFPIQCLLYYINIKYIDMNYSSRKVWMIYILLTIMVSIIYTFFISKKYESLLLYLIKGKKEV